MLFRSRPTPNSRVACLPEVFTLTRQLPISGASTTFSVAPPPCGDGALSGLYLARATTPCGVILLQGSCPTSGYSPCLALAITNLSAPHHVGTLGFFQTYSALPSRQVLCLAASDPLAVAPSGFSPLCVLTTVTGAFRSCLFSIAGRDFSGYILLRELFHAGCVFGKPNLDPLGFLPSRDFPSVRAFTCFQETAFLPFRRLQGLILAQSWLARSVFTLAAAPFRLSG